MTFFLLLVCFFLSGFAALLYETAWTREFAFVFGTSELAVVAVLAAYMGGLALGAALAARWAPRIRRPVLAYGLLELAIGLWAVAVPSAVRGLSGIYLGWLGGLDALPETLGLATHAFHLIGAFLILVPCTALMGATLPLLARHAVSRDDQIGPRVGLLYAVNTLGAIAGTTAAAFLLLPALGLRQTVYLGAAVNGLVFLAAAALARSAGESPPERSPHAQGFHWILPAIAVSGAVSFAYEVLWFRLLGNLIGGSTAAFSTMLASFLSGIALGSAVASRWARTRASAAKGFVAAQLATAVVAWLGFRGADRLPELARSIGASVNDLGPGALLAVGMLMPLTLCIGSTFPFAVRLLARGPDETTTSSARVYAWNTVGSIVGAVGTGYALLPWLGLEGTLVAAAATNLALAVLTSLRTQPPQRLLAGIAATLAGVLFFVGAPRPDTLLRLSPFGGIYEGKLSFLAVGRSSTVAMIDLGSTWRLTTNGLPESVISRDGYPSGFSPASWLSLLPVLARPETENMVVIGLGGAMTLSAVPSSVDSIEVIELEPEVVRANRSLPERAGGDPLDDPRVALRLGDARGALILANTRTDAIVSQPSHPWTSGASHLYTKEFFELVESRLEHDGVFVQWIGAAFVDLPRLQALLAALGAVFEHVEVYRPAGAAIVMLASNAPLEMQRTAARALASSPEDFAEEGLHRTEDVLAAYVLDSAGTRALVAGASPNSDDFNQLAMSGRPSSRGDFGWLDEALAPHDPLAELVSELDPIALARRLRTIGGGDRALRLADGIDPAPGDALRGWLAYESRQPRLALKHFQAAHAADPGLEAAALGVALLDPDFELSGLPARAQRVIEGRRLRSAKGEGVVDALRAMDAVLASWRPGELLHLEATELRVHWRVRGNEPAELEEALALLQPVLRRERLPRNLLLQAQLALALGRTQLGWDTLDALAEILPRRPAPRIGVRALDIAAKLGDPPNPTLLKRLRHASRGSRRRAAAGGGA